MLNFEDYMYTKDNRPKDYSPKHVEKRFYEIQTRFNPSEGDKFLFVTVNPDKRKHWFDWGIANNACNAFDFKMRRVLWKRKGRYIRPYVGCLETNETGDRYHFHGLLHVSHVKQPISEHEIPDIAEKLFFDLQELRNVEHKGIDIEMFSFSETTRDYGQVLHYMVKSANETFNPLELKVYTQKGQEKQRHSKLKKGNQDGNNMSSEDHYLLRS